MTLKTAVRFLFFYTILVIIWGAWVRISHSGNGCGEHWPLCQGEFVPGAGRDGKTWVEYTHRLMSGLYGIYVLAIWWLVRRRFPAGTAARRAGHAVFFFMVTEALLGARLVLLGLVTTNATWGRTLFMSLHQVNSLLLTGSVTALWLALESPRFSWRPRNAFVALVFGAIAVTGAWAALASTLFPAETLWEGLMKDFSPDSHHLLRLRILHPLFALLGGGGLAIFLWMKAFATTEPGRDRELDKQTAFAIIGAILFGMFTLLTLSPVWMRLTHLGIAHLLWAALIRWGFTGRATAPVAEPVPPGALTS